MTQGMPPGVETIRGLVEATNDKGIRIGGRWLNYSQFSQVDRPERGDDVEVEVAKGRFINSLRLLERAALDDGIDDPGAGLDDGRWGAAVARPQRQASGASGGPAALPPVAGREQEIRRQALIKAAAEFAAGRHDLAPEDVLRIAEGWERWVVEPPAAGASGESRSA